MDLQTTASKRPPARTLLVAALVVVALTLAATAASAASGAAQVYLGLRATGAGSAVGVDPTGVLDHCADDGHCYFRFDAGTVVTLAVSTTDPAATFVRWLGACTGSQPTCSVRLDRSRNVTARFSPVQLDVTSTPGEGTVEISSGGPSCGAGCTSFAYGDRVGLAAHACCGYSFDHWIGPCASVASASCRFTIYEPVEATPVFRCDGDCLGVAQQPLSRDVAARFEVRGQGRVTVNGQRCTGTCTLSFTRSQPLVLRADALQGSRFVGWSGTCTTSAPRCQFTAFRDASGQAPRVVATFSP